jgi:hypothetical protein
MKIKNIIKSAVKVKVTAAKAKAKAKVAAKIAAKAKCKGGKCSPCGDGDCSDGSCSPCSGGKCKPCAIALALVLAATMCGCQGLTSPSRSQTLTMRDCTVNIYGSGDLGTTNDVARVDIASQNMMIENSGTESQTSTPTQTTDVNPDIDVNYNGPTKSVADASQGVLESAVNVIKAATDKGDGSAE